MAIIFSGVALGLASAVLTVLFINLTGKWHGRAGYGVFLSGGLALTMLPSLYLQIFLLSQAQQESSDARVVSILCWVLVASLPGARIIYRAFRSK